MNEESFVDQLFDMTGPESSIGDDCAILDRTEETLLATVDSLSESIHFEDTVDDERLMTKLVGVNVSDFAAMGGRPLWALFAEGSSDEANDRRDRVRILTRKLGDQDIELVGGDTVGVSGKGCDYYSLTLLGTAHPDGILERTRAEAGDKIFVTGSLGAPGALRADCRPPWTEDELDVLYNPPNRIEEGRQLVESGCRCAIDLSDGLVKDLNRILRQSDVGAELNWTEIPVDEVAQHQSKKENERLRWALTGGEDFELLYTLPDDREPPDSQHVPIGRITDSGRLTWTPSLPDDINWEHDGYDHLT